MSRMLRIIAITVVVGVACCVAFVIGFPVYRAHASKQGSVAALAGAASMQELDVAAGGLGVVLRCQDSGWIAVAYRDSHSFPGSFSCAVARCSDGRWFASGVHFCGLFSHERSRKRMIEEAIKFAHADDERAEVRARWTQDGGPVHDIEAAASLQDAERVLISMGFAPMDPPAMVATVRE